ncbi:MAG TPA: hypothetical protein VG225_16775 [Terracidiphilus sp.]|jgi:hypothetical protein|nr:hypothetical protein [Terracidiphilus sp.]
MNRRTRRTLLVVAAVLVLLAVAIFLRSKAPPEAARLLPESDGILYVNLRPIRAFLHKDMQPPARVPDYQQFVNATGIDWERDLEQAAIALHRMQDPTGPNGPVAYSMVLVGKITGPRLRTWLEANAASQEVYGGKTIYSIPSEGRTVRVAQIGYDMVAISNAPTPEQIHSIVDRHRTAALPFAGSTLLQQHYRDVPLLAFAWGVGQIGSPFNESGAISVLGLQLPLQSDSTYIASVAPELPLAGALRVRVEEIAASDDAAASQKAALDLLITLARGFTSPLSDNPANRGLKDLLKSAEVTQNRNRVLIKATLPPSFFTALATEKKSFDGQATTP